MNERRQEGRIHLEDQLTVREAETGRALGDLIDISDHGMMLAAAEPLEVRRRYRLWIDLPGDPAGGLELSAEAAWGLRSLDTAGHRIGFRGLAISAGQEQLLSRLISSTLDL